jgi:very-short-patch-repair endonuclease
MARKRLSIIVKQTARKLRKEQTSAEEMLWQRLRNRQLKGVKFLRQHPFEFIYLGKKRFLVDDFYCAEAKLLVEIDGIIHKDQQDRDIARDQAVKSLGLKVIRINNEDIFNKLEKSLQKISNNLK